MNLDSLRRIVPLTQSSSDALLPPAGRVRRCACFHEAASVQIHINIIHHHQHSRASEHRAVRGDVISHVTDAQLSQYGGPQRPKYSRSNSTLSGGDESGSSICQLASARQRINNIVFIIIIIIITTIHLFLLSFALWRKQKTKSRMIFWPL